ncbi:hypothetical protein E2C01_048898 [Portunus trituberculatus]|uniref:Uncharacterized protein n=1 Tax=Portunus trituberculatus TaxID=210409 RepID=A0A5B7GCR8_PORTR|nr:hypothetical protein [Portunus trituberculatus]
MSRSSSIAGHSPDKERPTGMYHSSSNIKDLHKSSRHVSTGEDCSTPTLASIMDAIAALISDMDKLKKESKAVSTNEVQHVAPRLCLLLMMPVSQAAHVPLASPVGFSGFRSPRLKASSAEEEVQGGCSLWQCFIIRCQELWAHGKCLGGI